MRAPHGRYLSGLGGESPSGAVGYDAPYQDRGVYELEKQDDTYGSGIFDPEGRSGTSNPDTGVFASHNSLPGYVARDVSFTVSRDVTDITDGAEVVSVPAGGMYYVERDGRSASPAVLGPTYRPPQIEVGGPATGRDHPYKSLTRPGQAPAPPLNPHAPVVPPPAYHPSRQPTTWVQPVGLQTPQCRVPTSPATHRVPRQMVVNPFVRPAPLQSGGCNSGFGAAEAPSSGLIGYGIAGLLVGAATGWWVSKQKKGR